MKKQLSEAIKLLYDFWVKRLSDEEVRDNYVEAGTEFGEAASYDYLGECVGFRGMFSDWAKWELEYSRRGYRTVPLDNFIDHGGYGNPLKGLGIKREINERVILHASLYRKRCLK